MKKKPKYVGQDINFKYYGDFFGGKLHKVKKRR
jgi:hypothetical protein